jgi:uncharacterized protein YdhG (YjbR/CyaY superfamily)
MKVKTSKNKAAGSDQQESDLPKTGQPALRALTGAGIQRLEQLTKFSEKEIMKLHGMGPKALGILRQALAKRGLSFAGEKQKSNFKGIGISGNNPNAVDQFMSKLDHPLKAEVQTVREIIKSANRDITEEIKWNAPSFRYQGEYLVTFNLRAKEYVHLVFHNPEIASVKSKLLEGNYTDRRMAYLADMDDVNMKKAALRTALKDLIKLQKK